ncbi:hypothetical protein [Shinella sp.]|uniref:hypothetical protein n=1 Tax=Shinella sp. TaxID=1870904 RepID=UPI00301D6087
MGGKLLVRVKDAGTLVPMAPVAEKERLIEMAPDIYHETAHYKGWPALLEHFRFSSNRENALSLCFYAIPDAKPLRTFAGIALVRPAAIDDAELRHRLAEAWHFKAPSTLRRMYG